MSEERKKKTNPDRPEKLSAASLVLTTMAAAIGVQSDKNRQRDFSQSSIWPYIAAGVLFTVLFVFVLLWVVSLVVD